jgi:hypothetical protein
MTCSISDINIITKLWLRRKLMHLTLYQTDGRLIKYPEFLDILNNSNFQTLFIFLPTYLQFECTNETLNPVLKKVHVDSLAVSKLRGTSQTDHL